MTLRVLDAREMPPELARFMSVVSRDKDGCTPNNVLHGIGLI